MAYQLKKSLTLRNKYWIFSGFDMQIYYLMSFPPCDNSAVK